MLFRSMVDVTKYRSEERTRNYTVTTMVPETRTRSVSVTKYRSEERTRNYTVTTNVPEERTRTYTVTKYVPEQKTRSVNVTKTRTETKTREYQVTKMVPETMSREGVACLDTLGYFQFQIELLNLFRTEITLTTPLAECPNALAASAGLVEGHGTHAHRGLSTAITRHALLAAGPARFGQFYFEILRHAPVSLFESDGDSVLVVRTTDGTLRATEPAKHMAKNVVGVETGLEATGRPLGVTKLVKVGALLGVGQDVIGSLDLFELL